MIKKLLLTFLLLCTLCSNSFADGIDSYVKLMLHQDGADTSTTFTDSSLSPKTVTAHGNAQIDTAIFKFGGAAGLFDGTNSYISTPGSTDFAPGTGDFTIDYWVNFSSVAGYQPMQQIGPTTNDFDIDWNGAGSLRVYLKGTQYSFSWSPSASTWYHVAVTRSGTNLRAFINGTQIGTTQTSSVDVNNSTDQLTLGTNNNVLWTSGSFDEYRFSKGIARWTANFTPPTSAYSVPVSTSGNFFQVFD